MSISEKLKNYYMEHELQINLIIMLLVFGKALNTIYSKQNFST